MGAECVPVILILIVCCLGAGLAQDEDERPLLRVTSILVAPYLVERNVTADSNATYNVSDLYDGLIPDILANLSDIAGFDYEIQIVADGSYGRLKDGNWTGMIGELISGTADLAAAPLTITWQRETHAVDFTFPFHTYGIAGVIQRPPKGAVYRIPEIHDFPKQALMSYGTTKSSWIRDAFEHSYHDTYKSMWKRMRESIPPPLAANNNEGLRWVKDDYSFAFFLEETTADYLTHRKPCNLVKIETDLARREYAFAVPTGSPWRDHLNRAIEKITDDGTLESLKQKWFTDECSGAWRNVSDCCTCILLFICLALVWF